MTNMDSRMDTSSGRFRGQWAFLSNRPQYDRPRSIPASSYLRSDPSSASPIPSAQQSYSLNASRWSLTQNINSSSVGGYTSTAQPSQPVLVPVHSANASSHLSPVPRMARRRPPINYNDELPPIHDFSIEGILAAIEEDIEDDVNAISEILGRTRFVLADQFESHLPPQGIIRGIPSSLQVVEEGSGSNEGGLPDDPPFVHEETNLSGKSNSGPPADSQLERLKMILSTTLSTDGISPSGIAPRPWTPLHSRSLPAIPTESGSSSTVPNRLTGRLQYLPHNLLQGQSLVANMPSLRRKVTDARVSEIYLVAGTNGTTLSDPPVVREGDRYYPLYSYDERDIFDSTSPIIVAPPSLTERLQRVLFLHRIRQLALVKEADSQGQDVHESKAALRLREILERYRAVPVTSREDANLAEAEDLYE